MSQHMMNDPRHQAATGGRLESALTLLTLNFETTTKGMPRESKCDVKILRAKIGGILHRLKSEGKFHTYIVSELSCHLP